MADLSKNAYIQIMGEKTSTTAWVLDTSGAQHVYKGQPVIIDQSADDQNITPYVDGVTVAATDVCLGIAAEEKIVAASDPETTHLEVLIAPTIVGFPSAVFDNADLGKTVYMSDSATLSETAADNPQIGTLVLVKDGYAYVRLSTPQICAGA